MVEITDEQQCTHTPIRQNGFIVCQKCGLVLERFITSSLDYLRMWEPRDFERTANEFRQAVHVLRMPTTQEHYRTKIGNRRFNKRDYLGRPVKNKQLYKRLQREHNRYSQKEAPERDQRIQSEIIKDLVICLKLSRQFQISAAYYYKKLSATETAFHQQRSHLIGAIFYYLIKREKLPITLKTLVNTIRTCGHKIAGGHSILQKIREHWDLLGEITFTKAEVFIPNILANLDTTTDAPLIERGAREILSQLSTLMRSGRNPSILAGTAISLSAKTLEIHFRLEEIAQAAHCTPESIRNTRRYFKKCGVPKGEI